MSKQLEDVRKRMAARRRTMHERVLRKERTEPVQSEYKKQAIEEQKTEQEPIRLSGEKRIPYIDKSFFLMRTMIAICLFLVVGILFKNESASLEPARQFVTDTYQQEFQFAAVAEWYEQQFGKPLALLPPNTNTEPIEEQQNNSEAAGDYAIPATGVISEDFTQNGRGIFVQTGIDTEVEAVKGGYVIAVGESEEDIGQRVVVQHYDNTETTYGLLEDIQVNIYDHIEVGRTIGKVSMNEEEDGGIYYFALKQDDRFINPSEVMSFE